MRSLLFPAPRQRLARLRWTPWLWLVSWALLAAACVLVLLAVVAQRTSRAEGLRDIEWVAFMEMRALGSEVIRPTRDALEHAGTDPARIDWQQLGQAGLLVAVDNGTAVRVLASPPPLAGAKDLDSKVLRQIDDGRRIPVQLRELYCLALPGVDYRRVLRALPTPLARKERMVVAACFDDQAVVEAARVTLPDRTEVTFWRERTGVLRVRRGGSWNEVTATIETHAFPERIRDKVDPIDLSSPAGMLQLLVRGGDTSGVLQTLDYQDGSRRKVVHYIGGSTGDEVRPWTGFSISSEEDEVPEPTRWPSVAVVLLALVTALVVLPAAWSWSVASRLTRRIRRRTPR